MLRASCARARKFSSTSSRFAVRYVSRLLLVSRCAQSLDDIFKNNDDDYLKNINSLEMTNMKIASETRCTVVVVGDSRTGKSALLQRFVHQNFQPVRSSFILLLLQITTFLLSKHSCVSVCRTRASSFDDYLSWQLVCHPRKPWLAFVKGFFLLAQEITHNCVKWHKILLLLLLMLEIACNTMKMSWLIS